MLNREKIESALKNVINLLREDTYLSGNYSSYILPLLFFKWLSTLHTKDSLKNQKLSENLTLPREANWIYIRDSVQKVGKELTSIFSSIEKSNPTLQGIFINPIINQWERASDHTLKSVIRELSMFDFDQNSLNQPELLGQIYEDLIVNSGLYEMKSNVNFFTPYGLRKLIIDLIEPQAEMHIYDPACGSGGMLIEAARYFKKKGEDPQEISLWGQEEDYELRSIASMNLFIHGFIHSKILSGSLTRNFPIKEKGEPQKFDVVITNPPFGVKNWDNYESKHNSSPRFQYGDPPKSSADYVFIQHALALLTDRGRAAMIVPHGVLFRGGIEGEIRESIINDDLVEAVIGLPQKLFYTTKIATAIIIFNRQKSEDRKGRILFLDASHEYESNRKQNFLTDEIISRIVSTYSDFREEAGYSRIASHEGISKYGYTLAINRYVEPKEVKSELDIDSQVKKMQELEAERCEIEAQMNTYLKALGIKI
ncbi:N-6 DNA methylase [Leptolyngbya sp. FACHB-261]|uniref:N-6 DNA methylase n=1 Tax=Leptolyngbya sp. FACHB-261 TaxID=2692806 RepID=UPI0016835651|nr:N-6 DNA methylase [Leptolyngbya sp. FACHB-261]MBD2102315.1 N-6 DNA methylase [Leptolyngbya sp. FACHB-261]